MPMADATSLREHKKRQTRNALADAAFDIVRTQGAERLTAEAIADRAGVSRRTFFNYFPSVDAAVAQSVEQLLDQLTETLDSRPSDEVVWDTLEAMLSGPEGSALMERIAVLGAAGEHSAARHLAHDHVQAFVDWLAQWLTTRLGPDTNEVYAVTLAATVAAAAEATLRVWFRRTGGQITPKSLALHQELLVQALTLLRTGFDEGTR
ncbi:MAG TPA: TetR family transcriptional regulator [Phycicoccus sp.]|jgi:AcrR family transcriptional regulator|nr:TetR family transcriptional regulator [Phycicoccus sp.]HRA43898.1 TetR family transcriptional regulator [Phycicoccus sp.]